MFVAHAMDPTFPLAGRVLGALVFGCGAAGKLRHHREFVGVVNNYRLLPSRFSLGVAWSIILLEVLVGVSLATGWICAFGAVAALGLLAVFAVAMGINLARGRAEIDCGCFQSALRQQLSVSLLLRNFVLMLLLAPVLVGSWNPAAAVPASSGWSVLQVLDGVAAGVAVFLLYQAMGQLLAVAATTSANARSST